MKTCARFVVVLTVLGMGVAARAQTQTCTSPIAAWQGQFTLSSNGTGTNGNTQWTINESASAVVYAPGGATSCTTGDWTSTDAVLTGSVNDKSVTSCSPDPGSATTTIVGSTLASSSSIVHIDLSSVTYWLFPGPV